MKHFFLLIILLTSCIPTVCSQIFYKITGNNPDHISYILGTHHVAPITILDSLNGFNAALGSVDAVYGEVDLINQSYSSSASALLARMMAPTDSTLTRIFTPQQCDSITAVLHRYINPAISLEQFDTMAPISLTAALQTAMTFRGTSRGIPLDLYIQQQARKLGKEIGGFETAEFQMDILYGEPISTQANDLMTMIRNIDLVERSITLLDRYYLEGNIDGIAEIMNDPALGGDFASQERYIINRNRNWIEQLITLLPEESLMIVVGAGHLPGDSGLLQSLRRLGYEVTPM